MVNILMTTWDWQTVAFIFVKVPELNCGVSQAIKPLTFLGRHHQFPLITHTLWAIIADLFQGQKKFLKTYVSLFLLFNANTFCFLHYCTLTSLSFPLLPCSHNKSVHPDRQCFQGKHRPCSWNHVRCCSQIDRGFTLQPLQHTITISPIWLTAPVLHPPMQTLLTWSPLRPLHTTSLFTTLPLKFVLSQYWEICMS